MLMERRRKDFSVIFISVSAAVLVFYFTESQSCSNYPCVFSTGAFLIPYFIFLFGGGLPVFFLEVALGQYTSEGGITCWEKICPIFTGKLFAFTVVLWTFWHIAV